MVTGRLKTLKMRVVTADQLKALDENDVYVFKINEALELREATMKNPHTGEEYTK